MIRRPPRSTQSRSSAASDVYKRQAGGMTLEEHPSYYHSRVDRRREERARRLRKKRTAKVTSAVLLSVVCLVAAGWFGWKIYNDIRKASNPREYRVIIPEGLNILSLIHI